MEVTVRNLLTGMFSNIFEKDLMKEMLEYGSIRHIKSGDTIITPGSYIKSIPIILSGGIKVLRQDVDGNEILLYYVRQKETCAMSLTCCMARQQSKILAIAEEESEILVIPIEKNEEWMNQFTSWKTFVMHSYSTRFDELLHTIDSIAFHKVDERIIKYLSDKSAVSESNILTVSHQQIADELNSSREVISRLLKQLENMGKIRLGRNKIELLN